MEILAHISSVIGLVGIAVIIWGLLVAVVEFILMEYRRFRGKNICRTRPRFLCGRDHLGRGQRKQDGVSDRHGLLPPDGD